MNQPSPPTDSLPTEDWEARFERQFDVPVYMQEMMNEMRIGDADWRSMRSFIRTEIASAHEEGRVQGLKDCRAGMLKVTMYD